MTLVIYLLSPISPNLRYRNRIKRFECNLYLNGCSNVITLYPIKELLKYLTFAIADLNKCKLPKKNCSIKLESNV